MSFFDYTEPKPEEHTVFNTMNERDWRLLNVYSQYEDFRPGEELIRIGDVDDSVYIIVDGEAQVVIARALGRKRVMAVLKKGAIFGEMSFFERKPRSASVLATTSGRALKITRQDFERLLKDEPDLGMRLLFDFGRVLSMRNRALNDVVLR